jgi:hypothetical protein
VQTSKDFCLFQPREQIPDLACRIFCVAIVWSLRQRPAPLGPPREMKTLAGRPLRSSGIEPAFYMLKHVTKAQLLYSDVHGSAMRFAAEKRDLAESIAELREIADGHYEVLAEAAGITAGSWFAWPSTHVGYELVGAGMLIMAGGHDGNHSTTRS